MIIEPKSQNHSILKYALVCIVITLLGVFMGYKYAHSFIFAIAISIIYNTRYFYRDEALSLEFDDNNQCLRLKSMNKKDTFEDYPYSSPCVLY